MTEQNPASVAEHFRVFANNTLNWSKTFENQMAQQLRTNPSAEQLFLAQKIAETLTLIYLQDVKEPKHWQTLVSYAYTGLATAVAKADKAPAEDEYSTSDTKAGDNE